MSPPPSSQGTDPERQPLPLSDAQACSRDSSGGGEPFFSVGFWFFICPVTLGKPKAGGGRRGGLLR